jgi:hypothetical protein
MKNKKIILDVRKDGKLVRTYQIRYDETEGDKYIITISNCKYEVDCNGTIIGVIKSN